MMISFAGVYTYWDHVGFMLTLTLIDAVERREESDEMAEEEQVAIGGIASGRQQRKEHIEQDRDRDKGDGGTHLG